MVTVVSLKLKTYLLSIRGIKVTTTVAYNKAPYYSVLQPQCKFAEILKY